MASQGKRRDTASDRPSTASEQPSTVSTEEVLKPFQEASAKFLQARYAAQESAMKQNAQAYFSIQDQVREVEQAAYRAMMDAAKKHVDQMGQPEARNIEETYFARVQSQLDYQKEFTQICIDVQIKLSEIARKAFSEKGGEATQRVSGQQQDAYQAYMSDLQQAWSGTKELDPLTMNAIASNILFAVNRF